MFEMVEVFANLLLKIGFWYRADSRLTEGGFPGSFERCVPYQKINFMWNCFLERKNYKFKGILFRVWVRTWKLDKAFTVYIESEVLTTVIMKSSVFWGVTPSSPLKLNWRFGGTYCLYLQVRKISQATNQCEASSKQTVKVEPTCSFETSVDFSADYMALYPRR
jgi:hypothetical protein